MDAQDPNSAPGASTPPGPGSAAGSAGAVIPPVVAVLVTADPGPWFEEVLDGLAAQDYPNLNVLVIDAGSAEDPSARIGARLPGAYVRRLGGGAPLGFAAAANQALQLVQGAAFLCFLHDDVALDPSAVRLLVEEAYRSNAGVAGPKLVEWDDPRRLRSVGAPIDKAGVPGVVLHPGELDQEQHDAVQDVFVLGTACLLVRGDLFTALGGFDAEMALVGEDLDLCWRAHVAGARVVVVPAARARHRADLAGRLPGLRVERLAERHRLRSLLGNYSVPHLVRVVPQLLVLHVVLVVGGLLRGRPRRVGDVLHAWRWNLGRLGSLRAKRAGVKAVRQVPDVEIRNLQVRGSAQLSAFLRDQLERRDDRVAVVQGAGRSVVGALRSGDRGASFAVWIGLVCVLLLGSRHLLTRGVPAVGDLLPYPASIRTMLGEYLSGWRAVGLGQVGPQPTGTALLGLFGVPFLGNLGLARTVLVLGPVVLGLVGAWRLSRPLAVQPARVGALVAYAALPVAWNALGAGRWTGVLAYGAAPWILARLARATGLSPFGSHGGSVGPGVATRSFVAQAAALGLIVAVVTAFEPLFPLQVVLVAVGLVLGSLVAGGVARAVRAVLLAGTAAAVAVVLHLPWSFDVYRPGTTWAVLAGIPRASAPDRGAQALAAFHTGEVGGLLVLAVVAAAAYALVAGDGWRWAWAVRAWAVALVCFGVAVVDDRGLLPRPLPGPEVLLAPGAAALALAAALGGAAFVLDVRGRAFSWRHVLGFLAAAALTVGSLPSLAATVDGRWNLPSSDLGASLAFLRAEQEEGRFRVLWLGDPEVMPVAGFWLADGLAYALADDGRDDVRDRWAATPTDADRLVRDALQLAGAGETARLGRLLAPFGVKYVVVAQRAAPAATGTAVRPVPEALLSTLQNQLDFARVDVDDALVVYRNAAWLSTRASLGEAAAAASNAAGFGPLVGLDPGPEPTLTNPPVMADGERADRGEGPVPAGTAYLAQRSDPGWRLEVAGAEAPRRAAFGWANAFEVPTAGAATLRFDTPASRPALVALQAALWILALRLAWAGMSAGEAGARRGRGRGRGGRSGRGGASSSRSGRGGPPSSRRRRGGPRRPGAAVAEAGVPS